MINSEILNRSIEYLNQNSMDLKALNPIDQTQAIYRLIENVKKQFDVTFFESAQIVKEWRKLKDVS